MALRSRLSQLPVWAQAAAAAVLSLAFFALVSLPLVLVGGGAVAFVMAVLCAAVVLRTAHAGLDLYAVPLALAAILAFDFFYLKPLRTFGFPDYQNWSALALYLLVVVAVCAVSVRTRRRLESYDRVQVALLAELASLRRISRLVSAGASPTAVFTATAEEIAGLTSLDTVRVLRFEPDGTEAEVAAWGPEEPAGELAGERIVARVPIALGGRHWGVLVVGSLTDEPVPEGIEDRVASYTELVATALSNAQDRTELVASRARIVVAVDEARRRLERDLHDGIQQRLVALALDVRRVERSVPEDLVDVRRDVRSVGATVSEVVEEVREVARGIHPAILSTGGLTAALKSLARRAGVPVVIEGEVGRDLAEPVEVAAYYLVSEAVTNATKHARATEVRVEVAEADGVLRLVVADDGVGGADRGRGSGLVGMADRVHALGGRIEVTSPPGVGTTVEVTLPAR